MKLSVIIPVYNEESTLKEIKDQLFDSGKMIEEYDKLLLSVIQSN